MPRPIKVLIITDSLGFPRFEPELLRYEESYVALLKARFQNCDFIHHGRGGATILDLYKHSEYYHRTLDPDLVFIQSGVVDCAPRALTVIEQQVVSRLPLISRPLTALVKRYSGRLRRLRRMTYTPLADFAVHVAAFERLYANICWISILPASLRYEQKLPGISGNIERYNRVLHQRSHIATDAFGELDTMSDMYHLSASGHRKMAEAMGARVAATLRSVLAVQPGRTEHSPAQGQSH